MSKTNAEVTNRIEQDPVAQVALFSRTVVDALSGLEWLTNVERIDIADALSSVFTAEPSNPDLIAVRREALDDAVNAVRRVDDQYRRTGLDELSRERMALKRVSGELDDLKQKVHLNKRSAGALGWRKKEAETRK